MSAIHGRWADSSPRAPIGDRVTPGVGGLALIAEQFIVTRRSVVIRAAEPEVS